jgi:hypothetical protein
MDRAPVIVRTFFVDMLQYLTLAARESDLNDHLSISAWHTSKHHQHLNERDTSLPHFEIDIFGWVHYLGQSELKNSYNSNLMNINFPRVTS